MDELEMLDWRSNHWISGGLHSNFCGHFAALCLLCWIIVTCSGGQVLFFHCCHCIWFNFWTPWIFRVVFLYFWMMILWTSTIMATAIMCCGPSFTTLGCPRRIGWLPPGVWILSSMHTTMPTNCLLKLCFLSIRY